MKPPPYGKKIDPTPATNLIKEQNAITRIGKRFVLPILTLAGRKIEEEFYDNNFNAFVFSRSLINDLFEPSETPVTNDAVVVFLAAEKNGEEAGTPMRPTIILAGYEAKEIPPAGSGNFRLEPKGSPHKVAIETPPKKAVEDLSIPTDKLSIAITD